MRRITAIILAGLLLLGLTGMTCLQTPEFQTWLQQLDPAAAATQVAIHRTAEWLYSYGNLLAVTPYYPGAVDYYQQALALVPDQPDVHFALAQAYHNMGAYQAALETYNRLVAIEPDRPRGYLYRGHLLMRQLNDPAAALADYAQAEVLGSRDYTLYSNRGELSMHLRSRHQTGETLRESGVPVTEFQAGIIVGSGSISFEMIRNLTERIPVMICPRWVYTRTQPIAIRDTLAYLVRALCVPESAGRIIEIGGTDQLTYYEMMMTYARLRGLRRFIIPVPVLTPRLSSYWVHLVTPITSDFARPLIDGLRNEVIVRDNLARQLFPEIEPMDYAAAVKLALEQLHASEVETRWSDALVSSQGDEAPVVLTEHEGMLLERRQRVIEATPAAAFRAFTRLGGKQGWLAFNWAWRLRGLMDNMVGGVGFRRGRRHPTELRVGDALDFWRVEAIEADRLLRLRAEMKVPGGAWLQFKAEPLSDNKTRLVQTAFFAPKGLFGLLYWYALYPAHGLIFSALIRKVGELAETQA